jgi:uncharacterized membrane protein YgdD (TMEM256/DUF423 family)
MQKLFFSLGIIAAGTAVILGAFGAHALKERIAADQLPVFETGVRYQMYHAFALIIVGFMFDKFNHSMLNYSGYAFAFGIIFFCGSLYLLSMRGLLGIESWKFLGPITPLGGLCFIAGWGFMLISIFKK